MPRPESGAVTPVAGDPTQAAVDLCKRAAARAAQRDLRAATHVAGAGAHRGSLGAWFHKHGCAVCSACAGPAVEAKWAQRFKREPGDEGFNVAILERRALACG